MRLLLALCLRAVVNDRKQLPGGYNLMQIHLSNLLSLCDVYARCNGLRSEVAIFNWVVVVLI